MSPRLLKMVSSELAPALTFLFQQSFDTGSVPTQWKQALVSAIYKSGSKADPSNYRPISLTCISCKIMEHIVLSHMAKHLNKNNILTRRLQNIYACTSPPLCTSDVKTSKHAGSALVLGMHHTKPEPSDAMLAKKKPAP